MAMTDEQLMFAAADAAERGRVLVGELWNGAQAMPPQDAAGIHAVRRRTHKLVEAARELLSASLELNNRANGVKPPRQG